jgi:hypothetical protein
MLTVKAHYENGQIVLPPGNFPQDSQEVLVTFLNPSLSSSPRKNAGKQFVAKWKGVLKGCSIEGWREQKAEDLARKHP